MNTYLIPEENIERLEKSLATIQKKCNKNQTSFHYEKVGEVFKDVEVDGQTYTFKYIEVEVEGLVKHNGWKFVATIDHHEAGNVIRAFDTTLAVPEKYHTCGPTCEHCMKIRSRKDTYLIYNENTEEFKQVGKNCMQEFTNGLDAEQVALLVAMYEKVDSYTSGGYGNTRYFEVKSILRYAFECYRHFGYEKSSYSEYEERIPSRTTRQRVSEYKTVLEGNASYFPSSLLEDIKKEMISVNFDPESEYAVTNSEKALEWIKNVDADNEYLRNLQIICSEEYSELRNLGIAVSLTTAYMRTVEREEEKKRREAERESQKKAEAGSQYQGNIKDRLSFKIDSFKCVTAFENVYGTTFLYKIIDTDGNVYIWYASSSVADEEKVVSITGTVKDHSEYNGTKQTILTRCKVGY